MKKKHGVFVVIMALAMTGAVAQEDGGGAKVNLTLDFGASAVSVNSDGDVDSFTDSGFGEDNESTLSVSYEGKLFGGVASLGFATNPDLFVLGESGIEVPPLSINELYAWIKPFGEHFKFTGGLFANKDGVADYTDDIDNFGMGVFYDGSEGNGVFTEPEDALTAPALVNGFLAEAAFGPVTAQLLLAPNLSNKTTTVYFTDTINALSPNLNYTLDDAGARNLRIGGRLIADIGVGTVSVLVKTRTLPIAPYKPLGINWPGDLAHFTTFGAYVDFTAIENLGIFLGYTGYIEGNDDNDVKTPLWSGIDLRATWTGIEGLSLSTHNNISFSEGEDWFLMREDNSFLTLYNAVGLTKEINEKFSVNGEVGNVYSKTVSKVAGVESKIDYDDFWAGVKLISRLAEDTEFTIGVKIDYEKTGDETATIFSVPVGLKVSF
jgi:hypothetical protein